VAQPSARAPGGSASILGTYAPAAGPGGGLGWPWPEQHRSPVPRTGSRIQPRPQGEAPW